jgi:hypothetical protein
MAPRDARVGPIGGGTDENMKEILGRWRRAAAGLQGDRLMPAAATIPVSVG